jgi:hypothetical protein
VPGFYIVGDYGFEPQTLCLSTIYCDSDPVVFYNAKVLQGWDAVSMDVSGCLFIMNAKIVHWNDSGKITSVLFLGVLQIRIIGSCFAYTEELFDFASFS